MKAASNNWNPYHFLLALIILLILLLTIPGCGRTMYVYDSKIYREQYLDLDDFSRWTNNRIEDRFWKNGFDVHYEVAGGKTYLRVTPEMLEYVGPNGKGILKRYQVRKLKNSF